MKKFREALAAKEEFLQKQVHYFEAHSKVFEAASIELENRLGDSIVDADLDSNSFDLSITGGRAELNTLFQVLRKHGFETEDRADKKETRYSFWFTKEGCKLFIVFSSTHCKRIKVGERQVTEDIYEIVCDDDEPVAA